MIAGNGDSIFKRLMEGVGRPDLAEDPRFRTNSDRVKHDDEIDVVLAGWAAGLTVEDALSVLDTSGVPASKIYDVSDIAVDPQFLDRKMVRDFPLGDRMLKVPGIVPRMEGTPGEIQWLGPAVGEHNREVFQDHLGLSEDELRRLQAEGVI